MGKFRAFILALVAVGVASGCTHTQLRWNATHQSQGLTELYEQQVLDNLAMFVAEPNSLPYFSTPSTGSSQVTDQGSVGTDMTFKRNIGLDTTLLKLFGQRQMLESWSLSPVSDPRRLELMRCAYQQVVAACGRCADPCSCPNCEKLRNKFHIGEATPKESDLIGNYVATGKTSPVCLQPVCWLGWGCKKCVPDQRNGTKIGRYGETYVWVLPGGQDELSKLTLLVLDYAINQPATPTPPRTVEVEYRLNSEGKLVKLGDETAQVVKAVLSVDGKLPSYKPTDPQTDATTRSDDFLEQIRDSVAPSVPIERFQPPHVAPDIYQEQLNLRAVTPPPLQTN